MSNKVTFMIYEAEITRYKVVIMRASPICEIKSLFGETVETMENVVKIMRVSQNCE